MVIGVTEKQFVRVATVKEVPPGTMKAVEVEGTQIALCNAGGEFYAVHDECTHESFPLSEGLLDGKVLTCMLHGAQFDLTTGEVLALPAYGPVKTFEVEIDGEDVLIAVD